MDMKCRDSLAHFIVGQGNHPSGRISYTSQRSSWPASPKHCLRSSHSHSGVRVRKIVFFFVSQSFFF